MHGRPLATENRMAIELRASLSTSRDAGRGSDGGLTGALRALGYVE